MELFAEIVKRFLPLTNFVKKAILDLWLDSAYVSGKKDGNGFFPKKSQGTLNSRELY